VEDKREAVTGADVVVLAVPSGLCDRIRGAGGGKIVLDPTNTFLPDPVRPAAGRHVGAPGQPIGLVGRHAGPMLDQVQELLLVHDDASRLVLRGRGPYPDATGPTRTERRSVARRQRRRGLPARTSAQRVPATTGRRRSHR